jgi:hypothetical protein
MSTGTDPEQSLRVAPSGEGRESCQGRGLAKTRQVAGPRAIEERIGRRSTMHVRGAHQARQEAMRNTQDCEAICVQTVQYCLEAGGAHVESAHLRHLQDCADLCEAATKILLRGSPHNAELATACANLCDHCAASCERYIGDAQLKACANQCRLCAAACRQMASSATGAGTGETALRSATFPTTGV